MLLGKYPYNFLKHAHWAKVDGAINFSQKLPRLKSHVDSGVSVFLSTVLLLLSKKNAHWVKLHASMEFSRKLPRPEGERARERESARARERESERARE